MQGEARDARIVSINVFHSGCGRPNAGVPSTTALSTRTDAYPHTILTSQEGARARVPAQGTPIESMPVNLSLGSSGVAKRTISRKEPGPS